MYNKFDKPCHYLPIMFVIYYDKNGNTLCSAERREKNIKTKRIIKREREREREIMFSCVMNRFGGFSFLYTVPLKIIKLH